ncbi:maleylpyruvate isomerase N-terminal domain-containing protein [Streptacidiphilus sp. PAMC 29251]
MNEPQAFFTTLADRSPDGPTACRDWRVRDLVVHIAAGAREESELIEAALAGTPGRPTRPFAEREDALRVLPYPRLLATLAHEAARLDAAITDLTDIGGTVEFTGAHLSGAEFRMHGRSELALHRWDVVGDDDLGQTLLAQPELTAHAVKVLAAMDSLQESLAARVARASGVPDGFAFRLASPDCEDVVVRVSPKPEFRLLEPGRDSDVLPTMTCSPSDRLLLLWGRRPGDERVEVSGTTAEETRLIEAVLQV